MVAGMRFEGRRIRAGGSWGGPGTRFGKFGAGLGGSWGDLGGSWGEVWRVGGATWRRHGREKQQEREKNAFSGSSPL